MDARNTPVRPPAEAREPADIVTSSDAYAARFSGRAGAWMLEVQRDITLDLLAPFAGGTVLDVGGGHGQLAVPLAARGYAVTVLGSSEACAARVQPVVASGNGRFMVGDTHALPFPDRAFDAVISFRMVTHSERWPTLIRECCRVARATVIVDYPTSQSLNAVAPALFGAKRRIERDTRTWTLFRHAQIRDAFADAGFVVAARRPQFFLPMVLHRALRSRTLSSGLERGCRALGLTRHWGSPVILQAVPANARDASGH